MTTVRRTTHPQVAVARKALAAGDREYQKAAKAMQKLVDEGWRQREIADEVETSQTRVSRLLRALDAYTTQDIPFGEAYAGLNNPPRLEDLNPASADQSVRAQQVRARLRNFLDQLGPGDESTASELLMDLEEWVGRLREWLEPKPARRRKKPAA
jgi:hypothetical protein